MSKNKKFLIVLVLGFWLSFNFAGFSLAARVTPGSVPNTQPLQPFPDSNVTPNYSENINTAPQNRQGSATSQPGSNLREPPSSGLGTGPVPEAGEKLPSKSASRWWWTILGFALLFVGGELVYRWYQSKKPQRPPRT